jgi:PAS domain S-box-containing protein
VSSLSDIGVLRALEAGSRRAHFFECLPVACYACDCTGVITDYNRRAVELLGREPQATDRFTVAHKILDAQGNPLAPSATATACLLKSGLAQLNREIVIERPDGKRVTVLSNVAPLFDEGGNMIGALDVLQDITDRRWLEEARRVAERVKASARVATEVAQLKPALLSMLSILDLLGRDATLSVQARSYAELVRVELARFDALVKHMAHIAGTA